MIAHVQDLFAYTHWADARVLEALRAFQEVPEPIRRTIAHIIGAQQVWLARVDQRVPHPDSVWPDWDFATCLAAHHRAGEGWQAFLHELREEDLPQPRQYHNLAGQPMETPLVEIFLHVVNHSTYHRGQIALEARAAGHPLTGTDYILYSRERSVGTA